MYKPILFLYVFFIFLQFWIVNNAEYEGADCTTSGITGKCTRATNCPPAVESIRKNHVSGLKRCGWAGKEEVVCCPSAKVKNFDSSSEEFTVYDDNLQQNRFPKRKCEQACEEIASLRTSPTINFHIIGGVDADNAEFPHMAALGYENEGSISWDCSASVISNRFLLTAAHCIANVKRLVPKIARLGVTMLNDSDPQDYAIKNFTINPKYNPASKYHDIALVEIINEIVFSNRVLPACLYFENDDPVDLIITGWGKTSIAIDDDRSNILQKAKVLPVSLEKCNVSYSTRSSGSQNIIQTQICAGSNKTDACWGDSGGPLQIENKSGSYSIVGIISYGAGCGGKVPGVYTRVSKYLEWIEKMVWP